MIDVLLEGGVPGPGPGAVQHCHVEFTACFQSWRNGMRREQAEGGWDTGGDRGHGGKQRTLHLDG